jgi:hypothetical protein
MMAPTSRSGRPLYNLADVLAAEAAGSQGFRWSKLSDALAAVLALPPDEHARVMRELRRVMR